MIHAVYTRRATGRRRLRGLALAALLSLAPLTQAPAGDEARVVVFAAASTTDVITAAAERFAATTGAKVATSFAASSLLARQIESGAPADVFVSADVRWMDYLAERGLIDDASRCDLLRNDLVLIAPAASDAAIALVPGAPLAEALDGSRLAMGDPDHVPAGQYGRQALQALGLWRAVEDHIVRSANVRAALALVARAEAAFGIVYATDARVSDDVRVVAAFPPASHDPIVYPAARVTGAANPAADAFLDFLASAEGRALAAGFGFRSDGAATCSR